jgi:hypothetical protein
MERKKTSIFIETFSALSESTKRNIIHDLIYNGDSHQYLARKYDTTMSIITYLYSFLTPEDLKKRKLRMKRHNPPNGRRANRYISDPKLESVFEKVFPGWGCVTTTGMKRFPMDRRKKQYT